MVRDGGVYGEKASLNNEENVVPLLIFNFFVSVPVHNSYTVLQQL